ncbi:FAD-dependent oxidoreductase [Nocardia cyriacigeorgica]|uniref:FAD-dependent oxidoreductase n=1 Tax=Nocardia cyriacigeorgica TaxID=135487 RepID=UPI0002EB5763|nr:FAD-dependent oxidoreductase [Nocardia cyriacigeorgica]MBF6325015.1 FAD-dependent oxidoreductase [Nocardia cyriacigeorgica]MBF6495944.1 FAD-dependent oxidoreductase [Nocardia cyriacigeorgica]TLF54354.1 4Fe-4S ferredoxin [Nocardia cyriacigeorgica]
MPYVVTQSCCSDASCVYACPVNCIHPTPDEPDFLSAEMLYVDPQACVDCGACASACPVDAITSSKKLTEEQKPFIEINANFYRQSRPRPILAKPVPAPEIRTEREPLRVAIVGSGPSAMYAADELLTQPDVTVTMFDRLPVPYGLARHGVAPDHGKTRQVSRLFDVMSAQPGFGSYLNVEVGKHISHEELLAYHHAVIYAVGASSDRKLGIPGEGLAGNVSATDFVAWYNGHPDHAGRSFDLSSTRAVIVGNGNVALDVARILTIDPESLVGTDISETALDALRESRIEEVVILGRRGPAESAFTVPEFVGLLGSDVDIVIEGELPEITDDLPYQVEQKLRLLHSVRNRPVGQRRRIVFRYLSSPTEILGPDQVSGIEVVRNELVTDADGNVRAVATDQTERLDAGLVLTSVGYRGVPLPGLPFDERAGVIPNLDGRVLDQPGGSVLSGTYVTGWIKRGPTGFIGTNKSCAQQTVQQLADDFNAGRLREPSGGAAGFDRLVRSRQPDLRAGGAVLRPTGPVRRLLNRI